MQLRGAFAGRNLSDTWDKYSRSTTRDGIVLKELAKTLGVSYQQLQKYEKGRNRLPTHMLTTLAWKFGCTTDELCGLKEEPRSPELMLVLQKIDRIPSARLRCRLLKLVETAVEFAAVASDDSPAALNLSVC